MSAFNDIAGGVDTIEGLDQLIANLTKLPEQFGKFALEDAGRFALIPFITAVKQLAPVDDPAETPDRAPGRLRDSYVISTQLNNRQTTLQNRSIAKGGVRNYVEVYAGTGDPVGHLIEFGHFAVGPHLKGANKRGRVVKFRDTGKVFSWVPPRPHVAPAWSSTVHIVLDRAASEMKRNLDNAVLAMKT